MSGRRSAILLGTQWPSSLLPVFQPSLPVIVRIVRIGGWLRMLALGLSCTTRDCRCAGKRQCNEGFTTKIVEGMLAQRRRRTTSQGRIAKCLTSKARRVTTNPIVHGP